MVIPPNIGRWAIWIACPLIAVSAHAQVFTYRHGAEHFQAVVDDNRLDVKERYLGVSSVYGDLSCPLGGAVKASRVADSKLCLTFSKEMCRYTRYQNGMPLHNDELAHARMPRMCIALANDRDARHLARLVNAGTHVAQPPPVAMGATASERVHATVAGPDPAQPARESPPVPIVASEPTAPLPEKLEPREAESRTALPPKPRTARAPAPLAQKETRVADAKPQPGKWAVSSFIVGFSGNSRLREQTYGNATIVNKAGVARRPGGYLRLRNTSDKHPLYYGLHKQARYKLDPGESVIIPLDAAGASRLRISQQVTLRWLLDPEAQRVAGAARADARGRKDKASARGTGPARQPSTVTGRTLTVHPGEAPGHRKWVAAKVE